MQFSETLEKKFSNVVAQYPVRRSALIPMLMFAQDEYGSLTKEIIAEIAQRVGLSVLEVEGTISYYSMLRKKPAGKYHVQVCTNISCMLRGGEELFEHAKEKLGIGNKEITPDGKISLEEVECIGACAWAPAIQVNYDFHHDLTPELLDKLLDSLRK
jgi:NADH-quinone oxidoreductase subunit E